jgi:hypothetical protein
MYSRPGLACHVVRYPLPQNRYVIQTVMTLPGGWSSTSYYWASWCKFLVPNVALRAFRTASGDSRSGLRTWLDGAVENQRRAAPHAFSMTKPFVVSGLRVSHHEKRWPKGQQRLKGYWEDRSCRMVARRTICYYRQLYAKVKEQVDNLCIFIALFAL